MLSCTRAPQKEIFASLGFLSEVPTVGKDFIRARNPLVSDVDKAFELFRAFVRQARTFWEAAEPLHHRAGPLNYYYCFLNLVKAFVTLVDPDSVSQRVTHGLSAGDPPAAFNDAQIRVQGGVFPIFFKSCFGTDWPNQLQINVIRALAYCGDVTHEYETGGFGVTPRLMGMCRLEIHEELAYATLGVTKFQILDLFPAAKAKIEEGFDVVDLSRQVAEREFELYAEEARHFVFLETKKTFPIQNDVIPKAEIAAECYSVLKDYYSFVPYKLDHFEFALFPPYSETPYVPFNEVIAIYAVMFYLSSLVRYYPSYIEQMLESKEAWLIENFALSAPNTFLRHMGNLILNEERVYKVL